MTAIQWTDETWNPVTGCTRVSEGCRHCYIERTPPFRMNGRKLGDPVQLHPERLAQPLRWTKPRRVFVNSLSDLFHEDVPDEFLHEVFAVMALADKHTFQILTKRPERMRRLLLDSDDQFFWALVEGNAQRMYSDLHPDVDKDSISMGLAVHGPLRNVCLGVSVEDQKTADERIPILLQTPASVRFVSYEPALGPVDLSMYLRKHPSTAYLAGKVTAEMPDWTRIGSTAIDWIIAGGESGPGARPCDVAHLRSIVQQCTAAGVPVFVKQLGSYVVDRNDAGFDGDTDESWPMDTNVDDPDNEWNYQGAKIRIRLKDRKGGDPAEWPEDLRVREWPR